jgi:predicted nucleic-acid-binding Zn-ribbon protein
MIQVASQLDGFLNSSEKEIILYKIRLKNLFEVELRKYTALSIKASKLL